MMAHSPLRNNKGVALIITLSVVAILVTITFELNRQLQASVTHAAMVRDQAVISHMIGSGVEIAQALLIKDKAQFDVDTVQEDWANPDKIAAYLAQAPFDDGEIGLFISDELGRIQVNALVKFPEAREFQTPQRDLWLRFMAMLLSQKESMEDASDWLAEIDDPTALINPIKDWLDSGDNDAITGLNGAENEYYEDLDAPYTARNGPLRSLDELMRIKGITSELFYAADDESMGISNYLTVHGLSQINDKFTYAGKININTAELPVLAALLPIGQEFLATEIYNYRIETANDAFVYDLTGPSWYKEVPGCADVDIDAELISTQSDVFRIQCFAALGEIRKTATVIIEREKNAESGKWYCKVLNWIYE